MKTPSYAYIIAILAMLFRLAMIFQVGVDRLEFGDAADYVRTAHFVCDEKSYPQDSQLPFFRAPGLPFFIAAITSCNPENVALIKFALAVVDALTVR